MELFDVMRTTFSAREFTEEPLPDEVLFEILDNARFAPSGGNRQGGRVIVIRDRETRDALAEYAIPSAKRYVAQANAGESPWNSVEPSRVSEASVERTPAPTRMIEPFRRAPVVLVFAVDLKVVAAMDQFLDRVGVVSGASIYPLVWNVLMAARQAGFGGTITTLAVSREPDVQRLLGLPPEFAIAAVVPLGKPRKQLSKLRRRPVAEFVSRERFDGEPFIV